MADLTIVSMAAGDFQDTEVKMPKMGSPGVFG